MKRHLVVLILLAAAASACSAQMVRGWGVEGGATGAFQILSVTTPPVSPTLPRVLRWGFSAGAFVEFLNMPTLSLVLESAYAQKGRTVSAAEAAESVHQVPGLSAGPAGAAPRLDYVHIAMLVKLRAGRAGFVPYGAIGPRFAFLVGKADDPAKVFDNVKKSDVGATIAAGIEIVTHRSPILSIEGRWSPSFSRAFSAPSLTIRNQSVDVLLLLWL
ncbi:MAG TPA: porin family protein [Bacteroidota bacterium]|nr:porin family protein [Bacteroidota bacterium]